MSEFDWSTVPDGENRRQELMAQINAAAGHQADVIPNRNNLTNSGNNINNNPVQESPSLLQNINNQIDVAYHSTAAGHKFAIRDQIKPELDKLTKAGLVEDSYSILATRAQQALENIHLKTLSPAERQSEQEYIDTWNRIATNNGVKSAEEIYLATNQTLRNEHLKAQQDFEASTGLKAWSGLVIGGILGSMGDPVNAATAALPFGGALKGASALKRVMTAGSLMTALNEAVLPVHYQSIQRSKESIGESTSYLKEAAITGVAGFTLGAGLQGLAEGLSKSGQVLYNSLKPRVSGGEISDNMALLVAKAKDLETQGHSFTAEEMSAINDSKRLLELMKDRPSSVSEADYLNTIQEEIKQHFSPVYENKIPNPEKLTQYQTELNTNYKDWQKNLEEDLNQAIHKDMDQGQLENLINLIRPDMTGKFKQRFGGSIEKRANAGWRISMSRLAPIIDHYLNLEGTSKDISEVEFIKAIYGQSKDQTAIEHAKLFKDLDKAKLEELKALGIEINPLENWTPRKPLYAPYLLTSGKDKFKQFGLDVLGDMQSQTGKLMTTAEKEVLLNNLWSEAVTTSRKSSSLKHNLGKARVLNFKSPQDELSWLKAYTKDYNLFDQMIKYFKDVEKQIALAQTFGPEAEKTFYQTVDKIERNLKEKGKLNPSSNVSTSTFGIPQTPDQIFRTFTGQYDPASFQGMNDIMSGLAFFWRSAKFGSSIIPSVQDLATVKSRIDINGLDSDAFRYVQQFLTDNKGNQQYLKDLGFIVDQLLRIHTASARFDSSDVSGSISKVGAKITDALYKYQGLDHHTNLAKTEYLMSSIVTLTRQLKSGKINPKQQHFLNQYNFTEKDLTNLKSSIMTNQDGLLVFNPEVLRKTPSTQTKLMSAIQEQMDMAIIEPNTEVRSLLTGAAEPGSVRGLVHRSLGAAKAFPISQTLLMLRAGMNDPRLVGGSLASWIAKYGISSMVLSALAVQIQEVLHSKDLLDWSSPHLWARALAISGLGTIGLDYFLTKSNPAGDKNIGPLFGPLGSAVGTLKQAASAQWWPDDKHEHISVPNIIAKGLLEYTPFKNFWPTSAIFDHYITDQIDRATLADPEKTFRQRRRRIERNTGQGYYWEPGELVPSRFPEQSRKP